MFIPKNLMNVEYPSFEENLQALMDSLLKEEAAIAKLIRLEGDKLMRFTGENLDLPMANSTVDILTFVKSVKKFNDLITMKEWLFNQKLQLILILEKKMNIGEIENEKLNEEWEE